MTRKLVLGCIVVYALGLAALGAWLDRSSPGPPAQDIWGIGIGSYDSHAGIAFVSGRRLSCRALPATAAYTSRCTISIAGKPLLIDARRNAPTDPNQLGGACAATYAGRAWPCRVGMRQIGVYWFAYLDQPLGLQRPQLDALRRQYMVENWPEDVFQHGVSGVGVVSAVLAFLACMVLLRPLLRNRLALAAATVVLTGFVFLWSRVGAYFAIAHFSD